MISTKDKERGLREANKVLGRCSENDNDLVTNIFVTLFVVWAILALLVDFM